MPPEAQRTKILFADDEVDNHSLFGDLVEAYHNTQDHVVFAASGEEALGLIETTHGELLAVVTDLWMKSGKNGNDVAARALELGVPHVVIQTGDPDDITVTDPRLVKIAKGSPRVAQEFTALVKRLGTGVQ